MKQQQASRHEPTPEFRARLEQTITGQFRRSDKPLKGQPAVGGGARPGGTGLRPGRFTQWQRLRTAALVVLCLGAGAAGGVAYGQVQDARERSSLREVAQIELEVAQQREQLARAQHQQLRRSFDVGVATRDALAAAETAVMVFETERRRAELNLAEIELRSASPRDDLAAPLVRGRDFVRERLQADLAIAELRLVMAQREGREIRRRHELGLVSQLALMEAQQQELQLRFAVASHARRLELRRQFVDGKLTYTEAEEQVRRHDLDHALQLAAGRLQLAAARLEHVEEQYRLGAVDRTSLLRAELEMAERTAELEGYRARRAVETRRVPPQ